MKKLFITVLMSLSIVTQAKGGNVENGGDFDEQEFMMYCYSNLLLLRKVQKEKAALLKGMSLEHFQTKLTTLFLNFPDHVEIDGKKRHGKNIPAEEYIEIKLAEWKSRSLIERQKFSLHETLPLIGINDHLNKVSGPIFAFVESKGWLVTPSVDVSPFHFMGEQDASLSLEEQLYLKHKLSSKPKGPGKEYWLAKLRLQKQLYKQYDQRWWLQYKGIQKEEKVRLYWVSYDAGAGWANQILAGSAGSNYCKILKHFVDDKTNKLSKDIDHDAYRRGIVAEFPECFMGDFKRQLIALHNNLEKLHSGLFTMQTTVQGIKENKKKQRDIVDRLTLDFTKHLENRADLSILTLNQAFTPSEETLGELKEIVKLVSGRLGCDNCSVRIRDAKKKADRMLVLKVLYGSWKPVEYQKEIRIPGVQRVISDYQNRDNKDDLANSFITSLGKKLVQLEREGEARIKNSVKVIRSSLEKDLVEYRLGNVDIWRRYFSDEAREQFLLSTFSYKQEIGAFEKLEMGLRAEADLLKSIKDYYNEVITLASDLSLSVELGFNKIEYPLNDRELNVLTIPVDIPVVPAGRLLGRSQQEVNHWINYLKL